MSCSASSNLALRSFLRLSEALCDLRALASESTQAPEKENEEENAVVQALEKENEKQNAEAQARQEENEEENTVTQALEEEDEEENAMAQALRF